MIRMRILKCQETRADRHGIRVRRGDVLQRIAGSNRFEEILICCSVSEKGHRLHYKNDSRIGFTYAEYSKTLQLLSFNEYARDHDDDSTLETFVETEHLPIVACHIRDISKWCVWCFHHVCCGM